MFTTTYSYPLPNNGDRYDFTQAELVNLLNKVYSCGYENARNVYSQWDTSTTAVSDGENVWYAISAKKHKENNDE